MREELPWGFGQLGGGIPAPRAGFAEEGGILTSSPHTNSWIQAEREQVWAPYLATGKGLNSLPGVGVGDTHPPWTSQAEGPLS